MNKSRLNLLSFNIQVGIESRHYRHYFTRFWQHLLPAKQRQINLTDISQIIKDYDIVALQEVDGGSLRSSYINQVKFLSEASNLNSWSHQCNRNLGKLAQHSNGLLSRLKIIKVSHHKLPGRIPGRGAIEALLGNPEYPLAIFVVHLSLGKRARNQQLGYLTKMIQQHPYCILMGDWNTSPDKLEPWAVNNQLTIAGLDKSLKTYPSWQPKVHIDHILVSNNLSIESAQILDVHISDHLPIAVSIKLPSFITSGIHHDQ